MFNNGRSLPCATETIFASIHIHHSSSRHQCHPHSSCGASHTQRVFTFTGVTCQCHSHSSVPLALTVSFTFIIIIITIHEYHEHLPYAMSFPPTNVTGTHHHRSSHLPVSFTMTGVINIHKFHTHLPCNVIHTRQHYSHHRHSHPIVSFTLSCVTHITSTTHSFPLTGDIHFHQYHTTVIMQCYSHSPESFILTSIILTHQCHSHSPVSFSPVSSY